MHNWPITWTQCKPCFRTVKNKMQKWDFFFFNLGFKLPSVFPNKGFPCNIKLVNLFINCNCKLVFQSQRFFICKCSTLSFTPWYVWSFCRSIYFFKKLDTFLTLLRKSTYLRQRHSILAERHKRIDITVWKSTKFKSLQNFL